MTFYTESHPTARQEHTCDDCGRTIRPGETYRRGAGMDGARAWTWKECAHCEVLAEWLCRLGLDDDDEGYGPDTFDGWEPVTVDELRLKANWRRKWTRRDGALVSVPTRIEGTHSGGYPYLAAVVS